MQRKDKGIFIKVSESERRMLKRKAKKYGMTVSEFVRSYLIHSDNLSINVIDTGPIRKMVFEIHKHGVNLNQLMKFCNTYGLDAFNESQVIPVLEAEQAVFLQARAALESLKEEAGKRNVTILLETDNKGDGEEDEQHGQQD